MKIGVIFQKLEKHTKNPLKLENEWKIGILDEMAKNRENNENWSNFSKMGKNTENNENFSKIGKISQNPLKLEK